MRNNTLKTKDLRLYKTLDDEYRYDDTRYYGLFLKSDKSNRKIKVDVKRFNKFFYISEKQLSVIKKSQTHYFIPNKHSWTDYSCNLFVKCIDEISKEWNYSVLPMAQHTISEIKAKELRPGDLDSFNCGITDFEEASVEATIKNIYSKRDADNKRKYIWLSLHAQFFHQMVSKIEAVTVNVLTKNGWKGTKYSRNVFYKFKGVNGSDVKKLKTFSSYDKTYAIWNFLKHNSLSTYTRLKRLYPDVIENINQPYHQGELAIYFVRFDEQLINILLTGLKTFFKDYCNLAFGENYENAQWNYDAWFLTKVSDEIKNIKNPLGI